METVDIFVKGNEEEWDDALSALKARKEAFKGRLEAAILTEHRVWSAQDAREQLLIPQALGAISFPAHALSPYKFVCGLLNMCVEKGLNLQTNTPVIEVSPSRGGKWIVSTQDRGEVIAKKVSYLSNECLYFCIVSSSYRLPRPYKSPDRCCAIRQ